jgi:hypothetical protein
VRRTCPQHGESGQAVVEAAIVLPAMVFLILCAIQITLLQQARLAVEYAAFTAARAGVVMNGNPAPMEQAATWAVLPTFGRADSLAALATTRLKFEAQDAVLKVVGLKQVRVATLNPRRQDFASQTHLNGREIDFDDVRPTVAPQTLLSLQVRYLYQLRVPFANKMIQTIWLATQVVRSGALLASWQGKDLTAPRIGGDAGVDALSTTRNLALARGTIADGMPGGLSISALSLAGSGPRPVYLVPVNAWYSMRMQSNPFLKWAAP